jgi:hypothetical protein
MAINPTYGPIIEKSASDPNGDPGQTKGGVPVTASRTRETGLPTAGSTGSIPPFNMSPKLDPLAETFGPALPPGDPGE